MTSPKVKSGGDARTALLRACLDMSERDAAVTLAWIENEGPYRLESLLSGCLNRLAGEPATILDRTQPTPKDDAITALAAAVDLLVQSSKE